jgi:hypothetical protein
MDEDFAPSNMIDHQLVENQEAGTSHQNVERGNEPQTGLPKFYNVGKEA